MKEVMVSAIKNYILNRFCNGIIIGKIRKVIVFIYTKKELICWFGKCTVTSGGMYGLNEITINRR